MLLPKLLLMKASQYSVPLIISNADYGYVNRVTADKMREDREAIEDGRQSSSGAG